MTNTSFDLSRLTHAPLTTADLEGMGKRASESFLYKGASLNQSIVKLAQEHPAISQEQVKRVVEFANLATYAHYFEKQAGDKNIEFEIADPSVVLRTLNNGARPNLIKAAAVEYGQEPVKLSHYSLEADIELCRMFGVDPLSPTLEKVAFGEAAAQPAAPGQGGQQDLTDPASFLQQMPPGDQALQKGLEYAMAEKAHSDTLGNYESFASVLDAVKNTAETMSTQPSPKQQLKAQEQAMKQTAVPGAAPAAGAAPMGAPMGGAPGPAGPAQPTPSAAQPMAAPKLASIIKEAQIHVRLGGRSSDLVRRDLEQAVSLDRIKQASAARPQYQPSNPNPEIYAAWHLLKKEAEDVVGAIGANEELLKQAQAELSSMVFRSLMEGENIGAITSAMGHVASPEMVKAAFQLITPELYRRGLDLIELQAQAVQYEMEKSASARFVNLNNPLIETFSACVKLAHGQIELEKTASQIYSLGTESEELIKMSAGEALAAGTIGGAAKGIGGFFKKLIPRSNNAMVQAAGREIGTVAPKGPGMVARAQEGLGNLQSKVMPGSKGSIQRTVAKLDAPPPTPSSALTPGPRAMTPEQASGAVPIPRKIPASASQVKSPTSNLPPSSASTQGSVQKQVPTPASAQAAAPVPASIEANMAAQQGAGQQLELPLAGKAPAQASGYNIVDNRVGPNALATAGATPPVATAGGTPPIQVPVKKPLISPLLAAGVALPAGMMLSGAGQGPAAAEAYRQPVYTAQGYPVG